VKQHYFFEVKFWSPCCKQYVRLKEKKKDRLYFHKTTICIFLFKKYVYFFLRNIMIFFTRKKNYYFVNCCLCQVLKKCHGLLQKRNLLLETCKPNSITEWKNKKKKKKKKIAIYIMHVLGFIYSLDVPKFLSFIILYKIVILRSLDHNT
jgi:hypothetical protein